MELRRIHNKILKTYQKKVFLIKEDTFLCFNDFKTKYEIPNKHIRNEKIKIPFEDIDLVFKKFILQEKLNSF